MNHHLKIEFKYLNDIKKGLKTFEIRLNDRDYKQGDILFLNAWDNVNKCYIAAVANVEVTYILEGGQYGIEKDYVCMGIRIIPHKHLFT